MAPYGFDENGIRHFRFKGQSGTYARLASPPAEMDAPANGTMAFVFRVPIWPSAATSEYLFYSAAGNTGLLLRKNSGNSNLLLRAGDGSGFNTLFNFDMGSVASVGIAPSLGLLIKEDSPSAGEVTVSLHEWDGTGWGAAIDSDQTTAGIDWGSGNIAYVGSDSGGNTTWDDRLHFVQVYEGGLPGQGGRRLIDFNAENQAAIDWSASPNPTYTDKRGLVQDGALRLGGVSGQVAYAGNIPQATDDLTVEFDVALPNYADGTQTIVGDYDTTVADRSWVVLFTPSGFIRVAVSKDGSTTGGQYEEVVTSASWESLTGVGGGDRARVKLIRDHTTGSITFQKHTGSAWETVETRSSAITGDLHNSSANLTIGAYHNTTTNLLTGGLASVSVQIGGTVVANPDFTTLPDGTTSFVDSAGNNWTVPALSDNVIEIIGGDFANVNPERVTRVDGVRPNGGHLKVAAFSDLGSPSDVFYAFKAPVHTGTPAAWERYLQNESSNQGVRVRKNGSTADRMRFDVGDGAGLNGWDVDTALFDQAWFAFRAVQDGADIDVYAYKSSDGVDFGSPVASSTISAKTADFGNGNDLAIGADLAGNSNLTDDIEEAFILTGGLPGTGTEVFRYDGTHLPSLDHQAGIIRGRDGLVRDGALVLDGVAGSKASGTLTGSVSTTDALFVADLDLNLTAGKRIFEIGAGGSREQHLYASNSTTVAARIRTNAGLWYLSEPLASFGVAGERKLIGFRLDYDGSGDLRLRWYAGDTIATLAEVGTPVIRVGETAQVPQAGNPVYIGGDSGGAEWIGGIYQAWVRDGLAGPDVMSPDFSQANETKTAFKDAQGNVWTYPDTRSVITVEGDAIPLTYPLVTRAETNPNAKDGNGEYPGRWADRNGNGHDLTRFGATHDAARRAESFDGTDDYFELAHDPKLDVGANDSATWVMLVDADAATENAAPLAKRVNQLTASPGWSGWIQAGGFRFEASDGTNEVSAGPVADVRGRKALLIAVLDRGAGTLTTYVDGKLDASSPIGSLGSLANAHPVRIGSYSTGGTFMDGLGYAFPFFRYPLPPQEIQELARYLTGKRSRAAMALALRMI